MASRSASTRPAWQPTAAEQAAIDAAVARLDEEAGPPTEAEIQASRSIFIPELQAVLARKQAGEAA